ncbi:MAG TPA: hypothetical protein ENO23_05885, partial [Alphaproteobacteria bacterium]|nr:hypothetical protein [Alphaproteobacteria bacterium]
MMAPTDPVSPARRGPASPGSRTPAADGARRPERLKGLGVALFALALSALLLSSLPDVIRDHLEIARDPVRVMGVVDHVEADSAYGWRPYVA